MRGLAVVGGFWTLLAAMVLAGALWAAPAVVGPIVFDRADLIGLAVVCAVVGAAMVILLKAETSGKRH